VAAITVTWPSDANDVAARAPEQHAPRHLAAAGARGWQAAGPRAPSARALSDSPSFSPARLAPPRGLESAPWSKAAPHPLVAWIECVSCGRIDKPAHDFDYPADLAADTQLWVWIACERCGRQAKLRISRELKPAH
jgi:hypothetical protein